jgi:hypothetical protein
MIVYNATSSFFSPIVLDLQHITIKEIKGPSTKWTLSDAKFGQFQMSF